MWVSVNPIVRARNFTPATLLTSTRIRILDSYLVIFLDLEQGFHGSSCFVHIVGVRLSQRKQEMVYNRGRQIGVNCVVLSQCGIWPNRRQCTPGRSYRARQLLEAYQPQHGGRLRYLLCHPRLLLSALPRTWRLVLRSPTYRLPFANRGWGCVRLVRHAK